MQKCLVVSISIINYNDRKFIFKAIESAINQTYPYLDIIITDNNSTDGTREEIEKMIPRWEEKRKEIVFRWFRQTVQKLSFRAPREKSVYEEMAETTDLSAPLGMTKTVFFEFSDNLVEPKHELRKGSTREYGSNRIIYIKSSENTGFGRPHNQAIRIARGDFILLLNSDAILLPDYIENAIKPFDDPKVSSVQGKLLRYNFDKNELCKDKNNPKLNIIDTIGLLMFKNRRIICIGQGQPDSGQFEKETEVFGVDGAAPMYRKKALEDVKLPKLDSTHPQPPLKRGLTKNSPPMDSPLERGEGCVYEYFDENFFLYKEDVDLAWRMRLYGWKTVYTPKAIAYHGRGSGDSMAKNYLDIIKERRKINVRAKYLSFKHQRLMQIKNDFPSLLFTKHFPQFIIKEVGAWIYMAIFERFTLRVLKDLYRDVPLFLKKRKMVMKNKRVGAAEMERWFY